MGLGLALSSALSGVLLGGFFFGGVREPEPARGTTTFVPSAPLATSASSSTAFLRRAESSRTSSTTGAVFGAPDSAEREVGGSPPAFVLLIVAAAIFVTGYGVGSWRHSAAGRKRRRVSARVLDGAALARGTRRSSVRGGSALCSREDPRLSGESDGMGGVDASRR